MNILSMLWKNLWGGNRTMLFPARPTVDNRYRGLVVVRSGALHRLRHLQIPLHRPRHRVQSRQRRVHLELRSRLNAPSAVAASKAASSHALKEGHTEHALTQESACPPIYLNIGELKVSYTVARKKAAAAPCKGRFGCRCANTRIQPRPRRYTMSSARNSATQNWQLPNHGLEKGGVHLARSRRAGRA